MRKLIDPFIAWLPSIFAITIANAQVDRYRVGTYFVQLIQGKQHKELKLVKLSD